MIIKKVISGGQSGVDIAGLRAAYACDIPTGGTAPKGFKTEEGLKPKRLQFYGLVESKSDNYAARTAKNVQDADLTILIANHPLMGGSDFTAQMCLKLNKLSWCILPSELGERESVLETTDKIIRIYDKLGSKLIVNIAGHRESISPGIEKAAEDYLIKVFKRVNK